MKTAFEIFAQYLFNIVKNNQGEVEIDKLITYIDSMMCGMMGTLYPWEDSGWKDQLELEKLWSKQKIPGI